MDNEVKTRLKDIEQAIGEINSFMPEVMTKILKAQPNMYKL